CWCEINVQTARNNKIPKTGGIIVLKNSIVLICVGVLAIRADFSLALLFNIFMCVLSSFAATRLSIADSLAISLLISFRLSLLILTALMLRSFFALKCSQLLFASPENCMGY